MGIFFKSEIGRGITVALISTGITILELLNIKANCQKTVSNSRGVRFPYFTKDNSRKNTRLLIYHFKEQIHGFRSPLRHLRISFYASIGRLLF